jgi:hypothetical protein
MVSYPNEAPLHAYSAVIQYEAGSKIASGTKNTHPQFPREPWLGEFLFKAAKIHLFKIRRTPLGTFTFFTFGDIFYLSRVKKGLHFNFPPAGTKEFLG